MDVEQALLELVIFEELEMKRAEEAGKVERKLRKIRLLLKFYIMLCLV